MQKSIVLSFLMVLLVFSTQAQKAGGATSEIHIVPKPVSLTTTPGSLDLKKGIAFTYGKGVAESTVSFLQDFFKTGHNPTHNWTVKGDWKCTYFLNEKDLQEKEVIKALEDLLSRKFIDGADGLSKLSNEIKRAAESTVEIAYKNAIIEESKKVVDIDWFKEVYSQSASLTEFYENYKKLKGN